MNKETAKLNELLKGSHIPGPWFVCVLMTPALASKLLERNTANRSLSPSRVQKYARAIKDGIWRLSHQAIAFDACGRLIDGQHRLSAVVSSGISVEMVVAMGVGLKTFSVIDSHGMRSAADIVGLLGNKKNQAKVAAIAKAMAVGPSNKCNIDNQVIARFANARRELIDDYASMSTTGAAKAYYISIWVGAFCVAAEIFGRNKIDPLMRAVCTSNFLPDKPGRGKQKTGIDPMKALQAWIVSMKLKKMDNKHLAITAYTAAVLAIEHRLAGRMVKQIKVHSKRVESSDGKVRLRPLGRDFDDAVEWRELALDDAFAEASA